MPVVKTPLPNFTEFPKLKKSEKITALIHERIGLYVEQKRIKTRLEGDKKRKTTGLNYDLFSVLRHAITDPDVKSIEYDVEDDEYVGQYQVSMIQYEHG